MKRHARWKYITLRKVHHIETLRSYLQASIKKYTNVVVVFGKYTENIERKKQITFLKNPTLFVFALSPIVILYPISALRN